jgi:hypothetical protein
MQLSKKINLILFSFFTSIAFTFGQNCKCDSAVNLRLKTWTTIVRNSDSIKIVKILRKGKIKTNKQKAHIIGQLTSDSAIVAFPTSSKRVYLKIGRYDTLSGRKFRLPDYDYEFDSTRGKPFLIPGDTVPMQVVTFGKKELLAKELYKTVMLNNYFYEIVFLINGKEYVLPTICFEKYGTLLDNIFMKIRIVEK